MNKTVIATPAERAAMLPEPQVGLVVTVPMELWPAYVRLHGLVVAGGDKEAGVVICKFAEAAGLAATGLR